MAQRALLTDHEREALLDRKSDDARSVAVSRVREKISEGLSEDLEVLRRHDERHETDLCRMLREVVSTTPVETGSGASRDDGREAGDTSRGDEGEEASRPRTSPEDTRDDRPVGIDDDEMLIPLLDLPGSGQKLQDRQDAVHAAFRYIKDHREATPSELREQIYPDHDGQYQSAASWWNECVYEGFSQLADEHGVLQKPETADVWTYIGVDLHRW